VEGRERSGFVDVIGVWVVVLDYKIFKKLLCVIVIAGVFIVAGMSMTNSIVGSTDITTVKTRNIVITVICDVSGKEIILITVVRGIMVRKTRRTTVKRRRR
jgi:hypothetical protein